MLSLRSSKSASPEQASRTVVWITWLVRELTALVFIFSGFVKAVDPWGTLYKVEDYLAAMGLTIWPNLVVVGVFFLCGFEFFLGICLATGCFRKGTAWLSFLFICVMLPLTLWIAVFNPVADCGCFGDAFIISNWATFWKNIVLLCMTWWLLRHNTACRCLVTPALQWIALLATAVFISVIELLGFLYQPLIDFRPYAVGKPLIEGGEVSQAQPDFIFIYAKDGEQKEFTIDNLPDEDDGWIFIDRKQKGGESKVETSDGFHVWDGDEDVTDEVLNPDADRIILLMPDMGDVSISTTWKINSLYEWASRHAIDMIAAVAGTPEEIESWQDLSMPEYPIYTADDTAIKELARGNPAVVFTHNGIVRWKSSLKAINTDDFLANGTSSDPLSFGHDNRRLLLNITLIYLSVMFMLIMASFAPAIKKLWK